MLRYHAVARATHITHIIIVIIIINIIIIMIIIIIFVFGYKPTYEIIGGSLWDYKLFYECLRVDIRY